MRCLVDTHVFLWMTSAAARLGRHAAALLSDTSTTVFVSAATAWEIAIKYRSGKLKLPEHPSSYVATRMAREGLTGLVVEHRHAVKVADLPDHHRDPFDRLLIAQALVEGLPVVTADPRFAAYGVEVIRAD